jgi:hypothetical protein
MSIFFLTFANTNFMKLDRIIEQARNFDIFDKIFGLTEYDIIDFVQKHKEFIHQHRQGYGLWIWKPKIILDTLDKMKEDDILLYCDAGMYLNPNGKKRFKEYLTYLKNNSILTFSTSSEYIAQCFVKNDAIMDYYPEFNNELNITTYAGAMFIKKNNLSINFIKDWLKLCETYNYLDRSLSINYPEFNYFFGNDCDNGLFNLCLSKHKISATIYPDETNIYIDNKQIIHVLDLDNYNKTDWSKLDTYPIQYRRIRPSF